jgi:hypothetical protein
MTQDGRRRTHSGLTHGPSYSDTGRFHGGAKLPANRQLSISHGQSHRNEPEPGGFRSSPIGSIYQRLGFIFGVMGVAFITLAIRRAEADFSYGSRLCENEN